jgi:hypothetical protein
MQNATEARTRGFGNDVTNQTYPNAEQQPTTDVLQVAKNGRRKRKSVLKFLRSKFNGKSAASLNNNEQHNTTQNESNSSSSSSAAAAAKAAAAAAYLQAAKTALSVTIDSPRLGINLEPGTMEVTKVADGSRCAEQGVTASMVLVGINGKALGECMQDSHDLDELREIVTGGSKPLVLNFNELPRGYTL